MTRKLDVAFAHYDRTKLLANGTVEIKGAEATFHSAPIVTQIFEAMVRQGAFDVSELGMTYFLRTFDQDGRSPLLPFPSFPTGRFGTVPSTSIKPAASSVRRTLPASASANWRYMDTTQASWRKASCPTSSASNPSEAVGS